MEPLLTTEEIADYLRVEVVTVRRLVTRGELPAYRIGSEFRFIAPDIEAFVKDQRVTWPGANPGDAVEKFTERARKVFILANEEAQQWDHHYIGTEHLLLALVREGEGVAAVMLTRSGLKLEDVRQRVVDILERGQQRAGGSQPAQFKLVVQELLSLGHTSSPFGERPLTRRAKKVIDLAVDEARRLNHHYIGTEHLLLALVREGDGIAAQILVEGYGLTLDKVRELVMSILQQGHTPPAPPEIPEQAATLLSADEQGIQCGTCRARSPEYFHYCFNCGGKLQN